MASLASFWLRLWAYVLKRVVAPKVSTVPHDVLSDEFAVLFSSFLQQLKAKNLSPTHHA